MELRNGRVTLSYPTPHIVKDPYPWALGFLLTDHCEWVSLICFSGCRCIHTDQYIQTAQNENRGEGPTQGVGGSGEQISLFVIGKW